MGVDELGLNAGCSQARERSLEVGLLTDDIERDLSLSLRGLVNLIGVHEVYGT